MKVIVLVAATLAVVSARPQPQSGALATITKYIFENTGVGGYNYNFETSDGLKREETAQVINEGQENEYLAVKGSYQYIGSDNNIYTVNYTADEEGFQPEGDHLPPSAGVKKPQLGIPSAALASLAGK